MAAVAMGCRRWLGGCTLALALAACAEPGPPLMSPLGLARNYGYSEMPLGEGRYRVSYVGPYQRTIRSPSTADATSVAARTRAVDFAIWRAAQIATAEDYPGFSASNIRTDVDTFVEDYYNPYFGPLYGPGFGPGPFPWGPNWAGPYWGPSPYAYQRATATIDVELKHDPRPGDYDARDAVNQLRQHYPGAESATVEYGAVAPPTPLPGLPSSG